MKPRLKKLIIDGQIFQTDAKDRGMGRYSTRLLETFIKEQDHYQKIEIVLTLNLLTSEKIKQELTGLFKNAELQIIDLWTTKAHLIEDAFVHNEKILEDYVSNQNNQGYEIDFLIPSLFQEPVVSVFPSSIHSKLLIFYDLIPFLYHKRYEPVMNFVNYLKRFSYVFAADLIFSISQTVADDLQQYLGIPANRLVRIDGAAIHSEKIPEKPNGIIPDKFILMPTSDDPRKNNLRAVLGFEEFSSRYSDEGYKLVITSKIHKRERDFLQLFSDQLIFTGNLPEEQLEWLYSESQCVLFVPEYEGLGLPILEAVEFQKTVVCSSITVFKEIDENAFCYCDHENPNSIADALDVAVHNVHDTKIYTKIAQQYTWHNTVELFLKGVKSFSSSAPISKPKVAVFMPSSNDSPEIIRNVEASHGVMAANFEIDYYSPSKITDNPTGPDFLRFVSPMHSTQSFGLDSYTSYDAIIYHLGEGEGQCDVLRNALYLPGYVVLHSTNLDGAYQELFKTGEIQHDRIELEERLDQSIETNTTKCLISLLDRQLGVVIGSNYAKSAIERLKLTAHIITKTNFPLLHSYRRLLRRIAN